MPDIMPGDTEHWLWYERPGFVIAALIILWPVGAALMWSQRKFTYRTRVRVTSAAALLTVLVVMAVLPPLKGSIGVPEATETSQTVSPSLFAYTAQAGAGQAPAVTASDTATVPTSTVGTTSTPQASDTSTLGAGAPADYQPVSGPIQARFTMEGTYVQNASGSQVTFTLTALPASGIVSWDWWVNASGDTSQYTGATVQGAFPGLPPTSVKLVAHGANGIDYTSTAGVAVTEGKLYAAVR